MCPPGYHRLTHLGREQQKKEPDMKRVEKKNEKEKHMKRKRKGQLIRDVGSRACLSMASGSWAAGEGEAVRGDHGESKPLVGFALPTSLSSN